MVIGNKRSAEIYSLLISTHFNFSLLIVKFKPSLKIYFTEQALLHNLGI